MSAGLIASVVSACAFAGGLAGLALHRVRPAHHLAKETADVVRLGAGMLSVLAALVLGLMIATARDALDGADRLVRGFSPSWSRPTRRSPPTARRRHPSASCCAATPGPC